MYVVLLTNFGMLVDVNADYFVAGIVRLQFIDLIQGRAVFAPLRVEHKHLGAARKISLAVLTAIRRRGQTKRNHTEQLNHLIAVAQIPDAVLYVR